MTFRLVPKSVTLNDLERCNGVILRYFSEFVYLPGVLRKSSRSLSHLLMSSCFLIVDTCLCCEDIISMLYNCVSKAIWLKFSFLLMEITFCLSNS